MNVEAHIDQLRGDGSRVAEALVGADPDATVPACPDWALHDLVHHLGRIHRWATTFVAGGYMRPGDVEFDTVGGELPDNADLVEWFVAGHGALVETLAAAPATSSAGASSPPPRRSPSRARRRLADQPSTEPMPSRPPDASSPRSRPPSPRTG